MKYSQKITKETLTFDDVLLLPDHSLVLPTEVSLCTKLTSSIDIQIPIVSAAMDRVTESRLAIDLARQGGIGIIHKNMNPQKQAQEIDRVKRSESGLITDPVTLEENATVRDALALMEQYHISGVPIIRGEKLVGILTNRDIRFVSDFDQCVTEVMTKEHLITAPVGTSIDDARNILKNYKVEKLLIVDEKNNLKGLLTIKDINKKLQYPNACKDELGRLRVGAAVSRSADVYVRVELLEKAGVDVVVIDSAHGHHEGILSLLREIRQQYPKLQIIAGNVATAKATEELAKAGANAVKVGIGPGSICTTRVIAGVGVPQLSAVMDCAEAGDAYQIPVIADGGIRYSGDIIKALAAGAHTVMLGSLLAGLDESPGEKVFYGGRQYKEYRGMGSLEAIRQGSGDRYFQEDMDASKLVPEGIVGRVPYRGKLKDFVYQLLGGVRAGMGYTGCASIEELRTKAQFVKVSAAGVRESHPHDIAIVSEAPNYWVE